MPVNGSIAEGSNLEEGNSLEGGGDIEESIKAMNNIYNVTILLFGLPWEYLWPIGLHYAFPRITRHNITFGGAESGQLY